MESISAGGGSQYAKLYLDWNDLKQISGTNADKSASEIRDFQCPEYSEIIAAG